MAVGLEEHTEDVWSLFTGVQKEFSYFPITCFYYLAISVHKLVITFTMSLELLQTGPTMYVFLTYLVTFSLVNPFGIALGMVISETGHSNELIEAVLQGTFDNCFLKINTLLFS